MKSRLFLLLLIVFSMFTLIPAFGEPDDPPRYIHLTWQRDDTAHTMTVTWRTEGAASGTVLYDTVSREGDLERYRYSAGGITQPYRAGGEGYIHNVELRGLAPDTTYFFVCGGEPGGWSREVSFRTGPILRSDVRFVVGGDSRTGHDERDRISRAMSKFNPDFVLFGGDMVEDGRDQELWDSFLGHMEAYWTGSNGSMIPIIPALGNHEENSTMYYEQFALPGNEQWYSLDWGPDLHIVVLNSEGDVDDLREQASWLEGDLEDHASYPWKIVVFHRNVFKNYHPEWLSAFNLQWIPIFDKYGVDLVVNAHSHNYMRSEPINWTASKTEPQPSYGEGTMYLVSGGWGAPLYETVDGWWVAYTTSIHHFVLVDVYENGTMRIQAKAETGETFDEAWIEKEIPDFGEMMAERVSALRGEKEALEGRVLMLEEGNRALEAEIAAL
ncbi:MAG: purple acid phosphatase family protein, partial [Candidatus Bathyarchaeia archaeon]